MGKKVLICLSQRNLLLNSEALKKVEPDVYSCLKQNKRIYPKQAETFGIVTKINQNLAHWLNLSIKEWEIDRKGTCISGEKEYHCNLCNQPIQTRYKIINKKNQQSLYIGGNCSNNFKELAFMKRIVKNEDELYRYNKLLDKNEEFYSLLTDKKDLTEYTEIILPDFYQDSYRKAKKKLVKFMKNYIKNGNSLDEKELFRLHKIYRSEKKIMNKFVQENLGKDNVLSRSVAKSIERVQPKEYKEILKEVEKNRGQISPYTASKIKAPKYLKTMIERINKVLPDHVVLEAARVGTYVFRFKKRAVNYHFKIASRIVISSYYDKTLRNFPKWIEYHWEEIGFADKESKAMVLRLADFTLHGVKGVKVVEPNYHKIVNEYFDDLTNSERSGVYEKLSSLGQSYTVLMIRGSQPGEVRIYGQQLLLNLGKRLICLDSYNPKKFIEEKHQKFSNIDEYYHFLARKVVLR